MRRTRGATLVEVLLSLAVVLGGMLAMLSVLRSSLLGSVSASRVDQAEVRAQALLETMRLLPAKDLECLAATPSGEWARCGSGFAVGPWPFRLESGGVVRHGRVFDAQVMVGWGGGHAVTLRTGIFR
jgi:type II secretory pathway pseudopilin PulG